VKVIGCRMEDSARLVDGISDGRGRRRTRRGPRKRSSRRGSGHDDPPTSSSSPPVPAPATASVRQVCFIKRSRSISQAEEELRRALLVSVIALEGSFCATDVLDALISSFNLEADALDLRMVASNNFIVHFSSVELADRVLSGGHSLFVPPLRLNIKRWSRHALASGGGALPQLMELELHGIPAHLWRIETVESLLFGLCMIHEILPSSFEDNNRAIFKLRAWCPVPTLLPSIVDLHVEEPPVAFEVDSSYPRSLVYPISVLASCLDDRLVRETILSHPPLPDQSDDDRDIVQRKRRFGFHDLTVRASVKSRLGPRVSISADKGGPVDSLALPIVLDAELMAPGMGPLISASLMIGSSGPSSLSAALAPPHACFNEGISVVTSVNDLWYSVKGGPVDSLALPIASEAELTAPGVSPFISDSLMNGSSGYVWRAAALASTLACFNSDVLGGAAAVNALARMFNQTVLLMTSDFSWMTPRVERFRYSATLWEVSSSGSLFSALVPAVLAPSCADSIMDDSLVLSEIEEAHDSLTSALMVSEPAHNGGLALLDTVGSQISVDSDDLSFEQNDNLHCSLDFMWPSPTLVQQPCKILQVYSRRKLPKQSRITSVEEVAMTFINKIVKPLTNVLPVPSSPKLKARKSIPPNFVPRRSRRVAKLPPLRVNSTAHTICLKLGLKNGEAPVSADDLDRCAREFDKPLSVSQIKALATLFRWEIPDEEFLVCPADGLLQAS
jgi:hypothetical protein